MKGCSLEHLICHSVLLGEKLENAQSKLLSFMIQSCFESVYSVWLANGEWCLWRSSSLLSRSWQSKVNYCYTLQSKCLDDTEAEPRPDRDYSSFCFAPQNAAYSVFNFPFHPLCKIPMRSSSCCCRAHSELDFPISKSQRDFSSRKQSLQKKWTVWCHPWGQANLHGPPSSLLVNKLYFWAQMCVSYWVTRQ